LASDDVLDEIRQTIPLSKTRAETVAALRTWAPGALRHRRPARICSLPRRRSDDPATPE
jgi:hypothetical protein